MTLAMIRFCGVVALLAATNVARAQVMLVGCTAYSASNPQPSSLVDINLMTGVASNPRNLGILVMGGIATQPSTGALFGLTTFFGAPTNTLIRIDPVTGNVTQVGPTGLAHIVEGDIAFNPSNGMLYGIQDLGPNLDRLNLFRINSTTGAATVIGSLSFNGDYSALAFDSSGVLYAIDDGPSGNSLLVTVDPNTGTITNTVTMNRHLATGVGMTFDPSSGLAFVADGPSITNNLYGLDITTGFLTPIGPTGAINGICGLAFVNVPEPSSLTLAAFGCLFAGRRMFRSRRRT